VVRRPGFLGDIEVVSNFKLIEPAFASDKVRTSGQLDGFLLDHPGSDQFVLFLVRDVPLVEVLFHLRVLRLPTTALLAFTADLHPSFE